MSLHHIFALPALCVLVVNERAHTLCLRLSFPAARHQPNPVSSTLITWFLYNTLAGRNESLCLLQEMPPCSAFPLIHQLHRAVLTLWLISIQINQGQREGSSLSVKPICKRKGMDRFGIVIIGKYRNNRKKIQERITDYSSQI